MARGSTLIIQSVTSVLLVVLIILIMVFYFSSRNQVLDDRYSFSSYSYAVSYAKAVLSSSCLLADQCKNCHIYGLVSSEKLSNISRDFDQVPCENIPPVYSAVIVDEKSKRSWRIGPATGPPGDKLVLVYPLSLQYDEFNVSSATVEFTLYTGAVSSLKAALQDSCASHFNRTIRISSSSPISYDEKYNLLRQGDFSMHPQIGCKVSSFTIEHDSLLLIEWDGDSLRLRQ